MAQTEQLDLTSWKQSLKGRSQFKTLAFNPEVADACNVYDYKNDPRKRLLQIQLVGRPDLDLIDWFTITSGLEISIPSSLQGLLKEAISAAQNPFISIKVLDSELDGEKFEPLPTTGSATIATRIGQEGFRKDLIEYWEGRCAVSGLGMIEILKASHIKPWSESSDEERLDKFNGLLLSPTLDALFDSGFISFEDDGSIKISRAVRNHTGQLGINRSQRLEKVDEHHGQYLKYHRDNIYKGN